VTFSLDAAVALPIIDANSTAHSNSQQNAHRLRTIANFRAERQEERRLGRYRADVLCKSATRQQVLDVVVANPAAPSYMLTDFRTTPQGIAEQQSRAAAAGEEGWSDFEEFNYLHGEGRGELAEMFTADGRAGGSKAVEMREESKRAMYRGRFGSWADDPQNFIPFVVEATGRLGTAAAAFIYDIIGQQPCLHGKSKFINFIGAIIARQNALMAQTWVRALIASRP
jgi:hypothetical protein